MGWLNMTQTRRMLQTAVSKSTGQSWTQWFPSVLLYFLFYHLVKCFHWLHLLSVLSGTTVQPFQNLGGLLIFTEQIETRTLILYTKLRCYHTAGLLLCSPWMASHSKSAIIKWMAIPKPLEKKHLHVLGPAQNEYVVVSLPFFFWGPLSLAIHTTRIFLFPSVKTQHENQTGLLSLLLTVLHLKAGFTHCNFQSWKARITSGRTEPAFREESALAARLSVASITGLVLRKYSIFISLSFSIGTGRVLWEETPEHL